MTLAAADLTGWWIGYAIGAVVVVAVAVLVLVLIVTARRISATARDITGSLAVARDRTEVLWQVATTNQVAGDVLGAATRARRALGGDRQGAERAAGGGSQADPLEPGSARKGHGS